MSLRDVVLRFAVVFVSAALAASQCWHMLPALGEPPPEPVATVVASAPVPPEEPDGFSPENAAGAFGAAVALLALVVALTAMGRLSGDDRGSGGPGKDGRTTL